MRNLTFALAFFVVTIVAGCGHSEGPAQVAERPVDVKPPASSTHVVATGDGWRGELTSAVTIPAYGTGKSIILRNYDAEKDGGNPYERIKAKGDIKVQIALFDGDNELTTGNYTYAMNPQDKFVAITIFTSDGTVAIKVFEDSDPGGVMVTSIDGDKIEGTVDIKDDRTMVKGSFSSDKP
jgi:hypothetical protein